MPIQIVSANLNQYGDSGQFETDPSTWGFSGGGIYTIARSAAQKTKGLYSARLTMQSALPGGFFNFHLVCPARLNVASGKKYIAKAKVFTPSGNKVGNETLSISLGDGVSGQFTSIVNSTVINPDACQDTWVELVYRFQLGQFTGPGLKTLSVQLGAGTGGSGMVNIGGLLFVDQFEIYEFIGEGEEEPGEPDPEPEPEPIVFNKVFHSKNPIAFSKTAAAGWNLLTNPRLYNEVMAEDVADSGNYNTKLRVDLPLDSSGKATFLIKEAFRDVFSFTPPSLNQSDIVRLTDRIKRFKNLSGSLKDLELIPDELEEGDVNLVLYGGINKRKWPGLNYFTTYLPEHKKFLTWAPVEKEVDRLQEDYLNFWIYNDAIAELKLEIAAEYDDGSQVVSVTKSKQQVNYGELYQIPTGPTNSGAALISPDKNLVRYNIRLLDHNNVAISETRTFQVSLIRHPLTRFFMFLDSLGSFQVLKFTGQAVKRTEFSRDIVQKFLPHNYAALNGEFAINTAVMQPKENYSSGYLKHRLAKEWHDYMKDFLRSPIIYDVSNGERTPVVITGGVHESTDQDYAKYIQFDARPAYDDEVYTPDSI